MKKILFIATGGTIACADTENGLAPELTSEALLRCLPDLAQLCEIATAQPFSLDSTNMSPSEWGAVAELISARYGEYDGFVISHGTDTLGYAAAALSCMIQGSGKPIVLTGSQQPMSAAETDAKTNLSDAFKVAVDGRLGGVIVVFGGRIIDGRCAVKSHSWKFDAFRSVNRDELGFINHMNGLVLNVESAEELTTHDSAPLFLCRMNTAVGLVKLFPAMDAGVLDFVAERSRVLIIEGFGMGGFPDYGKGEFRQKIEELMLGGVIVIMTTQVHEGGSNLSVYEVGRAAEKLGVIDAAQMTTEYAVMRAMWALAYASSTEDFKELFLR